MKKYINIILFLITLFSNGLIAVRTDESTELDISPDNSTFSIWGLIYTSLFVSLLTIEKWTNYQTILFSVSSFSNILWLYFWSKKKIELANIFLFTLPLSLVLLWKSLLKSNNLLVLNSIGLYAGWTIGAFLLNTLISLKKNQVLKNNTLNNLGIILFSLSQIVWQLYGLLSKQNNFFKGSITIPVVGIWTALGIYRNGDKKSTIYIITSILSLINHLTNSINGFQL